MAISRPENYDSIENTIILNRILAHTKESKNFHKDKSCIRIRISCLVLAILGGIGIVIGSLGISGANTQIAHAIGRAGCIATTAVGSAIFIIGVAVGSILTKEYHDHLHPSRLPFRLGAPEDYVFQTAKPGSELQDNQYCLVSKRSAAGEQFFLKVRKKAETAEIPVVVSDSALPTEPYTTSTEGVYKTVVWVHKINDVSVMYYNRGDKHPLFDGPRYISLKVSNDLLNMMDFSQMDFIAPSCADERS